MASRGERGKFLKNLWRHQVDVLLTFLIILQIRLNDLILIYWPLYRCLEMYLCFRKCCDQNTSMYNYFFNGKEMERCMRAKRAEIFSFNKLFLTKSAFIICIEAQLPNKPVCHSKSQSNRATTLSFWRSVGGTFDIMSPTSQSVGGRVPLSPPGLTPMV